MVKIITTTDELESTFSQHQDKLVVVDFFATWCGPCVRIGPKIEEWSTRDFKDTVVFLKCDVDQSEALSQEFNIEAMPTFIFFKNGKEIHRVVGANPDQLKADIENKSK